MLQAIMKSLACHITYLCTIEHGGSLFGYYTSIRLNTTADNLTAFAKLGGKSYSNALAL